jgi:4-amino-4-deoxychorismate lyase
MCQLIESISLYQGKFLNLEGHEQRYAASFEDCFGVLPKSTISNYLSACTFPTKGWYKCRLLYDLNTLSAEFVPYSRPTIQRVSIVEAETIAYPHKYASRPQLDELFYQKGFADEIIMIKNGRVTDAYYFNLIFEKKSVWYTPATPLLKGTMRQQYLDNKKLIPVDIDRKDIINFDLIHFINAMNEPGKITINPRNQTLNFSQEHTAK